ncbi:MAG: VOC family protein [Paracoccaceae bacterium]|nr:VOC family protein [Paracoccaceae bacterium]
MSVIPYLHFQGDCARAMQFYAEVFGATDLRMMRYAEAPQAMPEWKDSDRVMHGQMTLGDGVLMASDFPPGQGDPQQAVSVMFTAADAATARRVHDRLAEGGAEIMPFGPTFFSPGFGMVKDRFGTHWMISAPMPKPA